VQGHSKVQKSPKRTHCNLCLADAEFQRRRIGFRDFNRSVYDTPLMKQKGVRWCYFCHVPGDICLPTRYYSSERRYKVCSDDVSDLCRNLIFDWQDFLLSSAGPTVQSYLLELGVGQVALEHLRCNDGGIDASCLTTIVPLPGHTDTNVC